MRSIFYVNFLIAHQNLEIRTYYYYYYYYDYYY